MKKIAKKKKEKKVIRKVVKSIPKKKKVTNVVKKTTIVKKISKKKDSVSVKKVTKNNITLKIKKSVQSSKYKKLKSRKTLIFAFGDQCFWIKDGPILRDLIDLRNVLYEISQDQFNHHVDAFKNDFASWVEHVLEDEYTSKIIRKAKSAKAMVDAIHKSLPKQHHR